MNYCTMKNGIVAGMIVFFSLQNICALNPEANSDELVVTVYMKDQVVKVYKPALQFTQQQTQTPEFLHSDCHVYYPLSWEYQVGSRRFVDDLDLENTDKVVEVLMNNSSALHNYKILQEVMEYYKDHPDTPTMRANFERIVQAYFSCPTVAESRDFYLFNLVYDMALKIAYSINFKAMAEIMFRYAGSLNQQNQHGETPAHVFVKNAALAAGHFFEVLHVFQQHGANFTEIKDFARKSVYDYMIERTVGYMMGEGLGKEVTIFLVKEYLKSQGFDFN